MGASQKGERVNHPPTAPATNILERRRRVFERRRTIENLALLISVLAALGIIRIASSVASPTGVSFRSYLMIMMTGFIIMIWLWSRVTEWLSKRLNKG